MAVQEEFIVVNNFIRKATPLQELRSIYIYIYIGYIDVVAHIFTSEDMDHYIYITNIYIFDNNNPTHNNPTHNSDFQYIYIYIYMLLPLVKILMT